jgi:hypothetical protein
MKTRTYWGGFIDGKLHWDVGRVVDWTRRVPAIFLTKREARHQYEDVRRVEVRVIESAEGRRK